MNNGSTIVIIHFHPVGRNPKVSYTSFFQCSKSLLGKKCLDFSYCERASLCARALEVQWSHCLRFRHVWCQVMWLLLLAAFPPLSTSSTQVTSFVFSSMHTTPWYFKSPFSRHFLLCNYTTKIQSLLQSMTRSTLTAILEVSPKRFGKTRLSLRTIVPLVIWEQNTDLEGTFGSSKCQGKWTEAEKSWSSSRSTIKGWLQRGQRCSPHKEPRGENEQHWVRAAPGEDSPRHERYAVSTVITEQPPRDAAESPSLEAYKTRLDRALDNLTPLPSPTEGWTWRSLEVPSNPGCPTVPWSYGQRGPWATPLPRRPTCTTYRLALSLPLGGAGAQGANAHVGSGANDCLSPSQYPPCSRLPGHTHTCGYRHTRISTHTGSPQGHILLGASVTASRALQTPPWPGGSSCSPTCLCRREGIGLGLPSQQGLILRQGIAL